MTQTKPKVPDPREGLVPAGCAALMIAVVLILAIAAGAWAIIVEVLL